MDYLFGCFNTVESQLSEHRLTECSIIRTSDRLVFCQQVYVLLE